MFAGVWGCDTGRSSYPVIPRSATHPVRSVGWIIPSGQFGTPRLATVLASALPCGILVDGKISHIRIFLDRDEALKAVGLTE
jgi:hypothetical protein